MKKITIILAATAVVITVGTFACNSAKGISTSNEGIAQMPGAVTFETIVKR